jgi:hypothetical protein
MISREYVFSFGQSEDRVGRGANLEQLLTRTANTTPVRRRHGIFGYMSPFLHPIRWEKTYNAHSKALRIYGYLFSQSPRNEAATKIVYEASWKLLREVCDWL